MPQMRQPRLATYLGMFYGLDSEPAALLICNLFPRTVVEYTYCFSICGVHSDTLQHMHLVSYVTPWEAYLGQVLGLVRVKLLGRHGRDACLVSWSCRKSGSVLAAGWWV